MALRPPHRRTTSSADRLLRGHACDVHALRILDLLYLSDYVDPTTGATATT